MSTNPEARAWIGVRADALLRNYARVAEAAGPDAGVLPMVKANAYGLGAHEVVVRLEPLDPWGFGVATADEGIELRAAGIGRPIVVCSPVPFGQIEEAVCAGLQLSVSSLAALERIRLVAERRGRPAEIHVDVDTGMGRSGFDWRLADEWLPALAETSEQLRWIGCYTHLHSADGDRASVAQQCERLAGVLSRVEGPGGPGMVHVLNSAGVFRMPASAGALVRPGIFLYGGRIGPGQPFPEPVASVHARVVHVRDAPEGTTLGYGATYTASGPERWATLSIGYGDGLPRALGNRGRALLHGTRVPIIGRISMDVTVVDISGVPAVVEGDVATLIGSQDGEEIALDDVAELADTISYEVLTGLTARLPRVWTDADTGSASTGSHDSESHDKEGRSS